jgi:hypothetical protein
LDALLDVLVRMAALIALGAGWRWARPGGLSGDAARGTVTALVYYLLLPALVVQILWTIELGLDSVRIAVTAALVVAAGWGLGRLAAALLRLPDGRTGALLLAAAFPNATYMGLPALDAVFGEAGRGIAIQFDYFACTPILLTLGVVMAQAYGGHRASEHPLARLARVPPFWAALAGVALNLSGTGPPPVVDGLLRTMGAAVVPLMLLALGMSLTWRALDRQTAAAIAPVLLIQLALLPLLALGVTGAIGLGGIERVGAILEAAMPSMVLGIVLCDRYGLDARFYSLTVTTSTLLSLATLPLWLYGLRGLA